MKKGVISVSLRLCMQVNLMFFVLHEHETLEADAWVALLLPALVHLGGHPLDVRVVILERWLNLGQLFLHREADMALSHFLAELVDHLCAELLDPLEVLVLYFDTLRGLVQRKLLHYEFIWLLHPLFSHYQFDFMHKLVEVSVLQKFHQNWHLSSASENELGKHLNLIAPRRSHLLHNDVLDALQQEHILRVLLIIVTFLSLHRNLVQICIFDELKDQYVGFPDEPLKEDMALLHHIEHHIVGFSKRVLPFQDRGRPRLRHDGSLPWPDLENVTEWVELRAKIFVQLLELIVRVLSFELDD